MNLTEVRVSLCPGQAGRLKAFCSIILDQTFVVRDIKIIEGNDGLFLAMPSRKLCDRCRRCGEKNHLRAQFCNGCGERLDASRSFRQANQNGTGRVKLHADIAHPINADCRLELERRVLGAYREELERSVQPGYVPVPFDDAFHEEPVPQLRPSASSTKIES